jgi:alpha-N-arabinofuranosidase
MRDLTMSALVVRGFVYACILSITAGVALQAAEFHVATTGDDANPGTAAAPLRTIQRGAELAQPGDVVTVHAGVYRERVNPPRGGESDVRRITYQSAPGEKVEIRGSEVVKGWEKGSNDTWKVTLPNTFFGKFNPYADLIRGDWFNPRNRQHHTGAVYRNGDWLTEAGRLEHVLRPVEKDPYWHSQVDKTNTVIFAQFPGADPNKQLTEINVRQSVFYPDKPGRNYITVRGFTMRHAATPWAPPTAEQIGLIGTHWSKGWIIENNVISHSVCVGITLGKYGDQWDNKAESAEGYVGTINRALTNGWNKVTVGSHIVRNNEISHCEQAGIVGSMGCAFSTITGNTIHDIYVRRLFKGYEMAGIKFHGAIDVEIIRNHIFRSDNGIWLDWMAQGTRVSRNLFHDNGWDLFVEANHGPFLVDNNLFLSQSLHNVSQGGAFVHNLMTGKITGYSADARQTPVHKPHSTEIAGSHSMTFGDDRFYNNLQLASASLSVYDTSKLPVFMDGNVFLRGCRPSKQEKDPVVKANINPGLKLTQQEDGYYLEMTMEPGWSGQRKRSLATTERLGKAANSGLPYEQPDGKPLCVNVDYFGKPRDEANPTPGPFENPGEGLLKLKVWGP